MQENRYDDAEFYERYCEMPRSKGGLEQAGEWEALRRLLPDFTGKRVLDLGCGFGWHCRYAAEQGAASVVGIDLSVRMLKRAEEMTQSPVIRYERRAIEEIQFAPDSFDVVFSSLALHYVADYRSVVQRVARCLTQDGWFIFSCEHPVFTASGRQEWCLGPQGEKRHWPVDRYFQEGEREAIFLGEPVVKYHRTLTTYLNTLLEEGFCLSACVEPEPAPHLLQSVPDMQQELRRPMMLLVAARKQKA